MSEINSYGILIKTLESGSEALEARSHKYSYIFIKEISSHLELVKTLESGCGAPQAERHQYS